MNTPIEVTATRSRHKTDIDEDSLRRSIASSTIDETPNSPYAHEVNTVCCAVCKKPIRGLFIICQFCNHAFHMKHYIKWFEEKEECPVNECHHYCNHSLSTDQLL